jgi:hypothetical protein
MIIPVYALAYMAWLIYTAPWRRVTGSNELDWSVGITDSLDKGVRPTATLQKVELS